ncbi:drug resistance transporter, EmrB/QacA subfamily [Sanguibacter gelidistatuariae]|uniref:Drug resistance transporter, EmrB/QacA subfamily n=1 Tax=Sanguibacter gelidistatuariae TaxID=1814289 RepID=A0A1G6MPI2_9MICO|nr:MFS transporter [Sanguibacter gelidistatuariae]SDC57498.1 drug resistance transporter, EmrB/QacA subfamily [Sanguibacter gelidistatuariae]
MSSATPPALSPPGSRRWLVLATVALAQLMVVLDSTIVNIALPSAQADLGFTNNDRQWVVTAYALAFGSLLLLGGRLSDMFGRRRMFLVGLVGFAFASALGGAAQSFEMLVGARALQGVFGAVLAPAALAVLTTTFTDPKERGRAFGVFGAIAGMGGAIGLLLGGYLTEHLDWRWNLYVNVLIAIIAFVAGMALLPRGGHTGRQSLDVPGVLLGSLGLFFLVFGFSQAEPEGWDSPITWGSLALSIVLLVGFVLRQRTSANPLLPLSIVVDRDRGASLLAILVAGSGMFGVFLFLTYYLQATLAFTPMQTGLAFLPMIVTLIITAQIMTNIALPRVGPRVLVPSGMVLGALAMVYLTTLQLDSTYVHVLPGLIVLGIAMGSIMPASFQLATLGISRNQAGAASAMVSTSQQVGGAIGTALLNTLAATAATTFVAGHLPATEAVLADAALHSYATAYTASAVIFLAGGVATVALFRSKADRAARAAAAALEGAPVETLPVH